MNYFVISEVCIVESEGAWDKEHGEAAVQAERIIFFGSKSQEEQQAKNQLSGVEVLPLTPPECGVREELILMSLGLSGTSRQHFWTE